jgi:hypothetical protein
MSLWLVDSPIVREFSQSSEWRGSGLDEKLRLQPGDVVWIGKQPERPEVKAFLIHFTLPALRRHFRGDQQHLDDRDFVWLSWPSRVVG